MLWPASRNQSPPRGASRQGRASASVIQTRPRITTSVVVRAKRQVAAEPAAIVDCCSPGTNDGFMVLAAARLAIC